MITVYCVCCCWPQLPALAAWLVGYCHATSAYHDKLGTTIYTHTFSVYLEPCHVWFWTATHVALSTGQITISQVLYTPWAHAPWPRATCSSEAGREFLQWSMQCWASILVKLWPGQYWRLMCQLLSTFVLGLDSYWLDLLDLSTIVFNKDVYTYTCLCLSNHQCSAICTTSIPVPCLLTANQPTTLSLRL